MTNKSIISDERLSYFENLISYKFKERKNLLLALTHSSYANENKKSNLESNERLEFLGDSILNLVISELIFNTLRQLSEGELTKLRAGIVCEPSLMNCATKIELGQFLLLGKGEEMTGGRERTSILSDAFEALIGAIFKDGGLSKASEFIKIHMSDIINNCVSGNLQIDYKTRYQEYIQKNSEMKVTYELISEDGPDHNKIFRTRVMVDNEITGTGIGRSKKESEQNAARQALERAGQ